MRKAGRNLHSQPDFQDTWLSFVGSLWQEDAVDGLGSALSSPLALLQAFSIDIIRHKDSMDELFSQRNEIFGTCGEEQKAVLQVRDYLLQQRRHRGESSALAQAEGV